MGRWVVRERERKRVTKLRAVEVGEREKGRWEVIKKKTARELKKKKRVMGRGVVRERERG